MRPNHIGVCRSGRHYVITAEYKSGYRVLARFATCAEAKAALPEVKALCAAAPAFVKLLRQP